LETKQVKLNGTVFKGDLHLNFISTPPTTPHSSKGIEINDNIRRVSSARLLGSKSSPSIRCPQPKRPSTPGFISSRGESKTVIENEKRPKSSGSMITNLDGVESEIQNILFHGKKCRSTSSIPSQFSIDSPNTFKPTNKKKNDKNDSNEPLFKLDECRNGGIDEGDHIEIKIEYCDEDDRPIDEDKFDVNSHIHLLSPSPGPRLNRESSWEFVNLDDEVPLTPPLRSSNPIITNSRFMEGYVQSDIEIGLLSVSPPLFEGSRRLLPSDSIILEDINVSLFEEIKIF